MVSFGCSPVVGEVKWIKNALANAIVVADILFEIMNSYIDSEPEVLVVIT